MLGRKELRLILNWWKILHEEYIKKNASEVIAEVDKDDEEKKDEGSEKGEEAEFEEIDKQIKELQV